MRTIRRVSSIALFTIQRASSIALLLLLMSCSDGSTTGPEGGELVRVVVSPESPELALGKTVQLQATAYTDAGPVQRPVTWSSSDTSVARVDAQGQVQTASRVGSARIRATVEGVAGEATLTVFTWDLMFYSVSGIVAETLVMPVGGYPERLFPIGRFAMDAAPSPDGMRIAYSARNVEGYAALWIAKRDGSDPHPLTYEEGFNDMWPTWSPDGTRIAFQSDRAGLNDIWVINVDGTGLRRPSTDPLPGVTQEMHPAWSPDGSRLAIRRADFKTNEWDIWTVAADGSDARRIALPGFQQAPSWRGDGDVITFTSRFALGQPWQVWTVNADGTGAEQQTPDNFTGGHRPMWLRRS